MSILKNVNKDADINTVYGKIDKLPNNIKKVIEPSINMNNIKAIAKFLVILYICSALFNFIQSILMTNVANKFAKKLRSRISIKINKLPLRYFDNNLSGDILSRVTNDVDTIAQSMNQSLATLVSSITLFVGSIIMMFYTNWIMAVTAILSSLIGFIFMFKVLSKSQKYFTARQVELGKLNGHIEEIYSGLNVVKAYNGKKEADKTFDELNKNVYECNRKSQFLSGLMQPMMGFIGNFGYVAVCIVGALLVSNDVITFGIIVAFITYIRLFTNPLSQIAQAMTSLQSTAAASERVFEFLEEKEMEEEQKNKYLNPEDVKGDVEFSHVKFGYNEDIIIKDFTANIKRGEKVAIVGPTGAGKTTMVNLLMKFYNINEGSIKIDGISINDLTRENIHSLFTMVLQDTWVFNGTVKENIIYNNKNISDEEIIKVCKEVGVHHFIKTLPNGYNSIITDGDSISSGQKQLLTIVRGMLDKAPLLILDEATSNVDTRTEELVSKAMDKLTEGRTSFIIAHRLSTIKNADLILVMKDGNIIEQGNHEKLIKENGFYAELYNSQFQK
ncbi:MAG: ABC transporter ATP-binding protein [Bacilli bacterium]|nr:ABC transporter ATP-binding protein [Bacilli bacterium]